MPIDKNCEHCGKHYLVPPARAASRFCSRGCADAGQTGERRKANCQTCGAEFQSKLDHGVWTKFCSRKCFCEQGGSDHTVPRECGFCGSLFNAEHSSTASAGNGYRVYCSRECANQAKRTGQERTCVNCGNTFYLPPSKVSLRPDDSCCSWNCRNEFYKGAHSPEWEGGHYHSESAGHGFTLVDRPGYVGKYIQDHRLVASMALGRMIERGEVVIHINRNKSDNRPENLFVCGSMSEFAKRRHGTLPWPSASNIHSTHIPKYTIQIPKTEAG